MPGAIHCLLKFVKKWTQINLRLVQNFCLVFVWHLFYKSTCQSRGTHSRRDCPTRDDDAWRVRILHRRGHEPQRVPVAPTTGVTGEPA